MKDLQNAEFPCWRFPYVPLYCRVQWHKSCILSNLHCSSVCWNNTYLNWKSVCLADGTKWAVAFSINLYINLGNSDKKCFVIKQNICSKCLCDCVHKQGWLWEIRVTGNISVFLEQIVYFFFAFFIIIIETNI